LASNDAIRPFSFRTNDGLTARAVAYRGEDRSKERVFRKPGEIPVSLSIIQGRCNAQTQGRSLPLVVQQAPTTANVLTIRNLPRVSGRTVNDVPPVTDLFHRANAG
jgi:hypothetical protein